MEHLSHNTLWPTVISTVVTLLSALTEILLFKEDQNMLVKINGLITRQQVRVIKKAAKILLISDKHDDLFFDELKKNGATGQIPGVILDLGPKYSVVKVTDIKRQRKATVSPCSDNEQLESSHSISSSDQKEVNSYASRF